MGGRIGFRPGTPSEIRNFYGDGGARSLRNMLWPDDFTRSDMDVFWQSLDKEEVGWSDEEAYVQYRVADFNGEYEKPGGAKVPDSNMGFEQFCEYRHQMSQAYTTGAYKIDLGPDEEPRRGSPKAIAEDVPPREPPKAITEDVPSPESQKKAFMARAKSVGVTIGSDPGSVQLQPYDTVYTDLESCGLGEWIKNESEFTWNYLWSNGKDGAKYDEAIPRGVGRLHVRGRVGDGGVGSPLTLSAAFEIDDDKLTARNRGLIDDLADGEGRLYWRYGDRLFVQPSDSDNDVCTGFVRYLSGDDPGKVRVTGDDLYVSKADDQELVARLTDRQTKVGD